MSRLASDPLEASFSSQHSWASLFRALLLLSDRGRVSSPLSALALPYKTFQALYRRFNGFLPLNKPSPFLRPECLVQVGGSCSPELFHLLGSPSADPPKEASPFSRSPHALGLTPPLDEIRPEPQGLSVSGLALSPRRGRRPTWLSSPTAVSNLFER
jgi:hypothetical protein